MHKIGVNYCKDFSMEPDSQFALLSDIGFQSIFTSFDGLAETEHYAVAAMDAHLMYESIHAPFDGINAMWQEGDAGEHMLARLCDCVDACKKNAVPYVVVHLSSGNHAPCVNDLGHSRFDRLIDHAVKNNVTVAFENQRKLANLAFFMELYQDVRNAGFCWDTGHEACFAGGREYMPLFGNKLVCTHIHDNFSQPGGDLHLIPFDGNLDFERRAKHLRDHRYTGTLTLEIAPHASNFYQGVSAEDYYQKAYAAALRLRAFL